VSDKVELGNGTIVRKHHDQLLPRPVTPPVWLVEQPEESEALQVSESRTNPVWGTSASAMERRYPTRERWPPERFQWHLISFIVVELEGRDVVNWVRVRTTCPHGVVSVVVVDR
jgi:hypothetical protein